MQYDIADITSVADIATCRIITRPAHARNVPFPLGRHHFHELKVEIVTRVSCVSYGVGQTKALYIYFEVALFATIYESICVEPTNVAANKVEFGTHLKG